MGKDLGSTTPLEVVVDFLEYMFLLLLFALRTISRDLLFSRYFSPVSLRSGEWSSSHCHCWKSISTEEF